jgi:hypothetical protein
MERTFIQRTLFAVGAAAALGSGAPALADPVSPTGWTSNVQLGAVLPQGFYFTDEAYYVDRSGPGLSAGFREVNAEVNIPVFTWSTPAEFLGGRVEAIAFTPELTVGVNPGGGPSSASYSAFYNPAALVGEAWNLGGGWSVSNFVGAFVPVDTAIGGLGLGGDFWTFIDLPGIAYNSADGWSLNANFIYLKSFDNIAAGMKTQADTLDVDFAVVKHIDKWELGLIGSAATDVSHSSGNDWGAHPFSQVSLGGLVGYTFGDVTTEVFATRSVESRNQIAQGNDTRIWGRIIIPLWNPPPSPVAAKY